MLKISKNDGFASFVEIVMTTGIFLITAVGIYSTIAMVSPKSAQSVKKLEAAYAGKSVIDQLYSRVSADTWSAVGGDFEIGRKYTQTVGKFQITYNFEIPQEFAASLDEEKPKKINVQVEY